jgi:hypothetical protein
MKSAVLVATFLPGGFLILLGLGLMFCVPVLYALFKKGDVRVQFARGKTRFELVAKERSSERRAGAV